jgi:hypothetical protein
MVSKLFRRKVNKCRPRLSRLPFALSTPPALYTLLPPSLPPSLPPLPIAANGVLAPLLRTLSRTKPPPPPQVALMRHFRWPKDRGGLDFRHNGARVLRLFDFSALLCGLELGLGVGVNAGAVLRAWLRRRRVGGREGGRDGGRKA